MTPKEINCDHCGRYIMTVYGSTVASTLCPNSSCKAEKQVKIITADDSKALTFKFANAPKPPKEKKAKEQDHANSN